MWDCEIKRNGSLSQFIPKVKFLQGNCFQDFLSHFKQVETYFLREEDSKAALVVCVLSCSVVWVCDPLAYSLPGSSVHGILQARILEWGAIPFSRGSSQPRDWTQISCIAGRLGMDFIKIIIQQEGYIQYNTWMKTSFQLIWAINFLIFFFWMKKANHYSFSALES